MDSRDTAPLSLAKGWDLESYGIATTSTRLAKMGRF